jgi:hypothetical protein
MCKVLLLLSNESLLSSFKSKIRPDLYAGWVMVHSKLDVPSVLNENLGGILHGTQCYMGHSLMLSECQLNIKFHRN